MIYFSLLLLAMFSTPYIYKLHKRRSIMKNITEISYIYPRLKTQISFRDLSYVILFVWVVYIGLHRSNQYGVEYIFIYSPLLLVIIMNVVKRFDDISITNEYIFFEMMHLQWSDVERVHVENDKTLVITSQKLMMGIVRIESIENITEIEKNIRCFIS